MKVSQRIKIIKKSLAKAFLSHRARFNLESLCWQRRGGVTRRKSLNLMKWFMMLLLTSMLAVFTAATFASAQVNPEINYQGKLTDTSDAAVSDADYFMRFRLYDALTGGTLLYTDDRSTVAGNRVPVANGLFSVLIGSTSPLTAVDFNQTLYLEVSIGTTTTLQPLSPRKKIGTVPAAFEASRVGGVASSSLLRSDEADTISASASATLLTIDQTGAGDILNILDSGASVFTVINGGNVGIGTTTPGSLLTVDGSFAVGTNGTEFAVTSAGLITAGVWNGTTIAITNGGTGTTTAQTGGVFFSDGTTFKQDTPNFFWDDTNNRLGIGTTSPDYPLHVDSSANTLAAGSPTIAITGEDNKERFGIISYGGDPVFQGSRSSGTFASPTATAANLILSSLAGSGYDGTDFSTGAKGLIAIRAAELFTASNQGTRLTFETTPTGSTVRTEVMRITAAGNIGIGTTTPTEKLSIDSGLLYVGGAGTSTFENNLNVLGQLQVGTGSIYLTDTATSTFSNFGINLTAGCFAVNGSCIGAAGGSGTVGNGLTGQFPYYAADGTALTATSSLFLATSGNIGIGTATPSAPLDVDAGALTVAARFNSTDASPFQVGLQQGGTDKWYLRAFSNGNFAIAEASVEDQFTIAAGGNIGVGTSSPSALLDLALPSAGTNEYGTIRLGVLNSTASEFYTIGRDDVSGVLTFKSHQNDTGGFRFNTQVSGIDQERLTILVGGNVGIGTSTPIFDLMVTGSISNEADSFEVDASTGGNRSLTVSGARINVSFTNGGSATSLALQDNGGNVGIGTTSPSGLLHIESTGPAMVIQDSDGTGSTQTGFISLRDRTGTENAYLGFGSGANSDLTIANSIAGGDILLTTTATGNVGIGTAAPIADLHIEALNADGNTNIPTLLIRDSDTTSIAGQVSGRIEFATSDDDADPTAGAYIEAATPNTNGDMYMAFATGGSGALAERLRITSGGSVGIGTANPTSALHVVQGGVTPTLSSSASTDVILSSTQPQLIFDETDQGADGQLWDFLSLSGTFRGRTINDAGSAATTWIQVDRTGQVVDSVVFPNGNVGIGSTTPNEKLVVSGGIAIDTNTTFAVDNTKAVIMKQASNGLLLKGATGSANDFAILAPNGNSALVIPTGTNNVVLAATTGNVGIGPNVGVPSQKFQVGDATGTDGTLDYSLLDGLRISGDDEANTIYNAGKDISITASSGQFLRLTQVGQTAIGLSVNTTNGFVGIGTASPAVPLHVVRGGVTPTLTSSTADAILTSNQPRLYFDETDASANEKLWDFIGVAGQFRARAVSDAEAGTSWLQVDRTGTTIDSVVFPNGNVGIGNSAPSQLLHVGTATSKQGYLRLESTGSGAREGNIYSPATGGIQMDTNANNYDITLNGSNVILNPTSNVGIGTTSPAYPLDVDGDFRVGEAGNANAFFVDATTGAITAGGTVTAGGGISSGGHIDLPSAFSLRWGGGSATSRILGNSSSNYLGFYTNTNENMRIISNGNVGIGTTVPNAKLHVYENTALGGTLGNSQLLTEVEGETNTSQLRARQWLYRDSTATNWTSARLHDGISIDSSFATPQTDTKTWWERDPNDNIQSWGNAASTYLTINAGNVGIGTTSPAAQLTVDSGSVAPAYGTTADIIQGNVGARLLIQGAGASFDNASIVQVATNGTNLRSLGTYGYDVKGDRTWFWGRPYTTSDAFAINRRSTAGYSNDTSNTADADVASLFYINSSGDVGIGDSTPGAKLTIQGGSSSSADEDILQLQTTGENGSSIQFINAFGTMARITGTKLGGGGLADEGVLIFSTATLNASAPTEKLRIDNNGNVGIGTSTPTSKFVVAGGTSNIADSFKVDLTSGGNRSITIAGDNIDAYFGNSPTVATSLILQNNGGNVGIGVTNPNRRLQVDNSNTDTNPLSLNNATIQVTNLDTTINNYAGIEFAGADTGGTKRNGAMIAGVFTAKNGTQVDTALAFIVREQTGAGIVEAMRISPTGDVGIGTSSPSALLDLALPNSGASEYGTLRMGVVNSTASEFYTIGRRSTDGTLVFKSHQNNVGGFRFNTQTGGVDTERFTITGTGNVGVGTSTPGAPLEVYTNVDITANADTKGLRIAEDTSSWLLSLGVSGISNEFFAIRNITTGTYPLVIDNTNGNIGFGDTTPDAALDVNTGSIYAGMLCDENGSNCSDLSTGLGTGNVTKVGTPVNNQIGIWTGNGTLEGDAQVTSDGFDITLTNGGINGTLGSAIAPTFTFDGDTNTGIYSSGANILDFSTNGSAELRIEANGNVCGTDSAFEACSSDSRLKENITATPYTLEQIVQLNPIVYEWNDLGEELYGYSSTTRRAGFIAQEVQGVIPEWVNTDENGYFTVEDGDLRYALLAGLKEQYAIVTDIEDALIAYGILDSKVSGGALAGGDDATFWTLDSDTGSIIYNGDLNMNGFDINNVRAITSVSGAWSIDEAGRLTVAEVQTEKLCIGSTCITEAQLKDLLAGGVLAEEDEGESEGSGSGGGGSTGGSGIPAGDTEAPVLTLNGNNPSTIKIGLVYSDLGVTVTDNEDNNLGYKTFVDGIFVPLGDPINIDTSTTTTYVITYNATDAAGNTASTTRDVTVYDPIAGEEGSEDTGGGVLVDEGGEGTEGSEGGEEADTEAPAITLVGDAEVEITVGDSYTDAGATAEDNIDGDITANIVLGGSVDAEIEGEYTLTYNVSDEAENNAIEVTRVVTVVAPEVPADTEAPVITLSGSDETLTVGESYTDAGATATDNIDGDITANISTSGSVDITTAGTYTVTYSVSDEAGNSASDVTRTVTVEDAPVEETPAEEEGGE